MLEVATLTPQYNAYWQQLYEEAFPAIERFEFETLQQLARQHEGLNLGIILDGARPVGLVVYQLNTQNVHQAFILFFAVDSNLRGEGLGAQALSCFKSMFPDGFVLECEYLDETADNYEQRQKRYRFYQKNGILESGYTATIPAGVFYVLRSSEHITIADYLSMARPIFSELEVDIDQ